MPERMLNATRCLVEPKPRSPGGVSIGHGLCGKRAKYLGVVELASASIGHGGIALNFLGEEVVGHIGRAKSGCPLNTTKKHHGRTS